MNGYKFRLQKLLDIRIDKEEESKIKFKEAQVQKENTELRLDKLKETYENTAKTETAVSLIERKIKCNYLNAVNQSINNTKTELDRNVLNLEGKRSELEKKQIERKTVEILRDKKETLYLKEQDMVEQKANDEFALYGFIRRRNSM
ncbi:MAG: flagellar export protein FliJ [Clostridiaceae bacterium]|nr:flagellar export protein FliJ [Clostridiaceae bacterium]